MDKLFPGRSAALSTHEIRAKLRYDFIARSWSSTVQDSMTSIGIDRVVEEINQLLLGYLLNVIFCKTEEKMRMELTFEYRGYSREQGRGSDRERRHTLCNEE